MSRALTAEERVAQYRGANLGLDRLVRRVAGATAHGGLFSKAKVYLAEGREGAYLETIHAAVHRSKAHKEQEADEPAKEAELLEKISNPAASD